MTIKPPQQSISLNQLSAPHQFDMSYPYCYQGPTCQLETFFTMKQPKQPALVCLFYNIGVCARPIVAFSGFYESHEPPSSGDARGRYRRIATAIEMAIKVGTFCIIAVLIVTLAAAGAIRSEQSPDGGVQWLLLKPWNSSTGRCVQYCTIAPPWLSKQPAMEVHLFAAATYFDCCNRS